MTGSETPQHLVVGHISKVHGVKGEVLVWVLTDHPESVLAPGVVLFMGDERGRLDAEAGSLTVTAARPFKKGWLASFEESSDRAQAEALRGRYLLQHVDDLAGRDDDELFYHELLRLEVVTVHGRSLGRVREVYEMHPSDLLEVRGGSKHYMVPFNRDIVKEVDLEGRRLIIDPPDGLLDL